MDFDDVVRVGSRLPEVEASTSYGTPSLKVRGKSFCRMWGPEENERKGPEPGPVLVVFCELEEKAMLIESSGGVLFDQDHYAGHGAVLVRLFDADEALLEDVLTESWRLKAPKRLLREFDARPAPED
jgi:hypothetical protein